MAKTRGMTWFPHFKFYESDPSGMIKESDISTIKTEYLTKCCGCCRSKSFFLVQMKEYAPG